MEDIVLDQIRQLSTDKPLSQARFQAERESEADILNRKLAELKASESRIIDLYSLGSISADAVKTKADAIKAERERIEEQLEALKNSPQALSLGEYRKAISTFNDLVDSVEDRMELYTVIRQLIQSITLDHDLVEINWKF